LALAKLAGSMRGKGFKEEAIVAALLETNKTQCVPPMLESEVKAIAHSISRYEPTPKVLSETLKTMDDAYFAGLNLRAPGVLIGFPKLDSMLSGLKPGRVYLWCARPNQGKTTLLTQIAKNLAKQSLRVLMFPTECGASSIYDKIVSSEAGVNLRKFQMGSFTEEEKLKIAKSKESLSKMSIIVAEDFSLTVEKIEQKIKEVTPDIVIIDYIQALNFPEGGTPQEIGKAVVTIKSFSNTYKIPILLASQLNRGSDGNKASLSQIKGSSVLEETADDVMFIANLDNLVYPKPILLSVMKSRYSETGSLKLKFFASVCQFEEGNND